MPQASRGGRISADRTQTSENKQHPQSLFGYDVVSLIGQGASGPLYAVTDSSGQLFTLKHVVLRAEQDERYFAQLQNEHAISRQFRHPGLRKVIDLKTSKPLFSSKIKEAALILEWVDGQALDEGMPEDLNELLKVFANCAAALNSLHRLLIVHCDFKPHNVLITADKKVKVIDFGQSCKIGTAKPRLQGTPDYITPEQVKCIPLDPQTDVYSFGASLYWCLTGQKVPTYLNADKIVREMVKVQKYPSPAELKPHLPAELSDFVMHCLRYSPTNRPADMLEVLNVLDGLIQKPAPVAAPVAEAPPPRKVAPQPRRVQDWGLEA